MKLLLCGDIHITDKTPDNRCDDFPKTLFQKLSFIVDQSIKNKCVLLSPGDVFDRPGIPYSLFSTIATMFKKTNVITILGQHDLRFRTKINTPLLALSLCIDSFRIATSNPITYESVKIYGSSYDEEIPIPDPTYFSILLVHKMLIDSYTQEWEKEYDSALVFLKKHKYSLILSGDNHQSFIVEHKNRLLVNCGSLMRTRKDQINHKPMFVIYDTDTRKYQKVYIPIKPAEEVFDMAMLEREKEKDERLAAYVEGLIEGCEIGLDFQANLFAAIKTNKVNESVETIIKEAMQDGN